MNEKKIVAAAARFVSAAKYCREADLRRSQYERSAAQIEYLTVLSDYYRALGHLATAEQDLILAFDGEDDPKTP